MQDITVYRGLSPDECMTWAGDSSEKARLLRQLRDGLPPSITVEDSPG